MYSSDEKEKMIADWPDIWKPFRFSDYTEQALNTYKHAAVVAWLEADRRFRTANCDVSDRKERYEQARTAAQWNS